MTNDRCNFTRAQGRAAALEALEDVGHLPRTAQCREATEDAHPGFFLLVLGDEISRRDGLSASLRAERAHLEPDMQFERWDPSAKVTYDQQLLNELMTLRFLDTHHHVAIVGPVGVGKTFVAQALGHVACRRGKSVLSLGADAMFKTLKHARLDNSFEAELRKLIAVDLLIVDDFCLDLMDPTESRDAHEILRERHRAGSMVITYPHLAAPREDAGTDPRRLRN